MALVTLQRSPSPSNDPDEGSADTEEGADGKAALRHKRSKSTLQKLRKIFSTVRFVSKLRPCLSESYFTVKGAALILPHSEINRKTSRKNHGGEIQRHLQSMLYLLRPEDKIKVAIRLENQREKEHRYMALVSTTGRQDTEECVILGLDCTSLSHPSHTTAPPTPPSSPVLPDPHADGASGGEHEGRGVASATIGLVLPLWMGMKVRLSGDGGFSIITDDHSYLFKPVSVQAMWSAIQSLDKALHSANQMKYLAEGLTHTWVEYYRSKVDTTNQGRLALWNLMEDVEIFAPSSLKLTNENESEKLKLVISAKLKEVMTSVDLEEATSRSLRLLVEEGLNMKLDEFRGYFDEEMMRILGQMDAPSQILDFLYLGSEWNASNLEELQRLDIKYILNVTREIDNFFTGMFHYFNVRIYDYEDSELMKYWLKTNKFINKARKHNCKVLVHCKMGVSRSASTVIAYLMKENRWPLDKALDFVKGKRSCVRPNKGFMDQLHTYEGILTASNKRHLFRSKSEHDLPSAEGEDGEASQQDDFLGDSLFHMISGCEWPARTLTLEEEILLRKGCSSELGYSGMEPDFETDSRSADSMEESFPDMPSPQDKDPPLPGVAVSVQDPQSVGVPQDNRAMLVSSGSPPRQIMGLQSRLKPDTSWIKLEMPGESSTDPPTHEGMDTTDPDAPARTTRSRKESQVSVSESVSSPASPTPVIFVMGAEWDGDTTPKTGKDGGGEGEGDVLTPACGGGDQAGGSGSLRDMGVHQYYSREQIPWHAGKVRNIREELCRSGQGAAAACHSDPGRTNRASADERMFKESEKSLLEAVGKVKEAHPVPQCESCVDFTTLDKDSAAAADPENMEVEDVSRSVYDMEDIPLIPGTVQRTRQEIEQRQKLYGEECDLAIYGMKAIKRSSSLREKRESSRNRHSERRKTCTPIVSPPPEKETEEEEEGAGPVLRLDFEVEESSTDQVAMETDGAGQGGGGEGCGGQAPQNVTVYTFGHDTVPLKVGMVQQHKREIESKSSELGWGEQRSLSVGSSGSASSVEDMELTSQWTPTLPTVVSASQDLASLGQEGLVHATYIPPSQPAWSDKPFTSAKHDKSYVASKKTPHEKPSATSNITSHENPTTPGKPSPHEKSTTPSKPSPHEKSTTPSKPSPHEKLSPPSKPSPHEKSTTPSKPSPHEKLSSPGKLTPHEQSSTPSKTSPHDKSSTPSKPIPHEKSSTPSKSSAHVVSDKRNAASEGCEASVVTASIWRPDSARSRDSDHDQHGSRFTRTDGAQPTTLASSQGTEPPTTLSAFSAFSSPGPSTSTSTQRYSGEGRSLHDAGQDTPRTEPSVFRPYSHSLPSGKRGYGRSNFDPETLAMIREIGSAFVTSPGRVEDDDGGGESTSLVKHLVKNIERESRNRHPARKIVLLDMSGRQERGEGRRHTVSETGPSSLYSPSPQFTLTMSKHLAHCPQGPASAASQGREGDVSTNASACPDSSLLTPSSRTGAGDRSRSEPPSVVKHLKGRFESQGHSEAVVDSSESSPSHLPSSDSDGRGVPGAVRDRGDSRFSSCPPEGLPKCQSLDESVSCEWPAGQGSHMGTMDTSSQSASVPRPQSEPSPYSLLATHRQAQGTSRVHSSRDTEVGAGVEEGEEGCEGAKMRRLHGKSHPLSRLQFHGQGERVFPSPIQRHSPFHSTM